MVLWLHENYIGFFSSYVRDGSLERGRHGGGGLSNTPGGWSGRTFDREPDLVLKRTRALVTQIILFECTHAVEPEWNLLLSSFRTAEQPQQVSGPRPMSHRTRGNKAMRSSKLRKDAPVRTSSDCQKFKTAPHALIAPPNSRS